MDGYFDKLFCPCRKLPLGDGSAVLVGTSIRTFFFQLKTLMDYALKGPKGFLLLDITFLAVKHLTLNNNNELPNETL